MANGHQRRRRRHGIPMVLPLAVAFVLVVFGVFVGLGPYQQADLKGYLAILVFGIQPGGLLVGLFAGIFWLPACWALRSHGQESLPLFLLAGAIAGWLFGYIIDGAFSCDPLGVLGLVVKISHLNTAATETCIREYDLVSPLALLSAFGAGLWALVYWYIAVLPNKKRRKKLGSSADRTGPRG